MQLCKFRLVRSTSEHESRYNDTVCGKTQWNRKLSWKRHAVYTEALWCVKLYTKYIYIRCDGGRKTFHMTLMTTTTTKVLMLLCLILPTTINDANFWLTIDELVFFTFQIIRLQSFDALTFNEIFFSFLLTFMQWSKEKLSQL